MAHKYPTGTVDAVLIAPTAESFYTYPVGHITLDVGGNRIVGNPRHGGHTMPADVRAKAYQKKHEIANRQSVTIADATELDLMAEQLGLDATVAMAGLRRRFEADKRANWARKWWNPGLRRALAGYEHQLARVEGDEQRIKRLFLAQTLGIHAVIAMAHMPEGVTGLHDLARGYDVGPFYEPRNRFSGGVVEISAPNTACKTMDDQVLDVYGQPLEKVVARSYGPGGVNLRGVVAWVVQSGPIVPGDTVHFIPYRERQSGRPETPID
jgi:hypothetical protein